MNGGSHVVGWHYKSVNNPLGRVQSSMKGKERVHN